MKTLNFLFVLAFCFMVISHVSATTYIIKTFENYSGKDSAGEEGQLTDIGQKRVQCFKKLVEDNTINQIDAILYKSDGKDKMGNIKINSRKFTAEAIAQALGVQTVEAMEGDDAQVAKAQELAGQFNNPLFVWSDQEKANKLAVGLGATDAPASFKKSKYGYIWVIEGNHLEEKPMNCEEKGFAGVKDAVNGSQNIRLAVISVFVTIMATLYFLF